MDGGVRARDLIAGEGVREGLEGLGSKGFGSGGVGGRGTGGTEQISQRVVFFVVCNAYKKKKNGVF